MKNVLVGQSGGPTAVINSSLAGVYETAKACGAPHVYGMQYGISVENQPYPVLCTLSADGCTAHVPDFPKITAQAPTLDAALPTNSVLVLVKAG